MVSAHKIIDCEKVFAIKQPGAASDDLLELDHGIDGAQQNNIPHIARIHAGGELLRRGQNRWDGLFVVLKLTQILITQRAVVCSNAATVIRIFTRLLLIDEVADGSGVELRSAENDSLLTLVNPFHQYGDALLLALFNFNDAVEVRFGVATASLHFTFNNGVVRRVHVVV